LDIRFSMFLAPILIYNKYNKLKQQNRDLISLDL